MFYRAAKDHKIDLKSSIMIGDKRTDFEASNNAKIKYYVDATKKTWLNDFTELIKKISEN